MSTAANTSLAPCLQSFFETIINLKSRNGAQPDPNPVSGNSTEIP